MDPSEQRRRKKWARARRLAQPDFTLRPSNEALRAHLANLTRYLSIAEIARRSGVSEGTVWHQANSPDIKGVLLSNAQALMRVRVTPEERAAHMKPEEIMWGAYRLLQGLSAQGWTMDRVAGEVGFTTLVLRALCRTPAPRCLNTISRDGYVRLRDGVARLEGLDPIQDGKCDPMKSKMVRTRATRRGMPTLAAWDLDEIHLVDSIPEWTGACGTTEGFEIHGREGIPMCPPCAKAGESVAPCAFSPTKLRIRMDEVGHSAESLAEAMGVHLDSIYRWRQGARVPRDRAVQGMAVVLDCSTADLMDGDEPLLDQDFRREALIRVMEEKGMSFARLAMEIGVSTTAIQYWCNGTNTPKIPKIVKAASVLGVEWKEFYR